MSGDAVASARMRRARWVAWLGGIVLRVLGRTWRIRQVNRAALDALRERRQPAILALWHGELLPLLWHHRHEGISILISEHVDGEVVARVAESLGCRTVRGSTTRGGGRALLGLCRVVETGGDVAITPDGPRGPARRFAPGALVVAQRGNAPIVPLVVATERAWRLKSWDGFLIPKPFARITVAYGAPTLVTASTPRAAAAEAPRFEMLMRHAAETAASCVTPE